MKCVDILKAWYSIFNVTCVSVVYTLIDMQLVYILLTLSA